MSMNKIVTTPGPDSTVRIADSTEAKITVLSPVGFPPKVSKKTPAPRPESLDGKTVYLVDCRFDDTIELLKQVQGRSEEHTSELQSQSNLVCRLLLEKKKKKNILMMLYLYSDCCR